MKSSPRLLVSFVAAAFFSAASFAQNISLKLQDAATGDPVSYATVSLTVPGKASAYKYVLT